MRSKLTIVFLLLILSDSASSQIFTDSNLPIIIINTDGGLPITYYRILGSMKIIYRGPNQRNYVTDQNNVAYLNYNGRIDIEIRGDLTVTEPKKQYGFTTRKSDNIFNNNVSLLGMPPENDWILNGMVLDKSMIRDYLCFNLSRQLGEYASRTVYCELILNGEYEGLYLLTEKIKADDNRVNIIKIAENDINLPELSGGFITKTSDNDHDPVAWTMLTLDGEQAPYTHHFPKPLAIDPSQHSYIYNQFNSLAATALASNASISDGFPSVIDIPSFINYIIINELSSNSDAYRRSTFFHKDRNGKLRAGPIWDSDLTFYRIDWQFLNSFFDVTRFWKDLVDNSQFRCYLSKRWNELIQPGQPLNLSVIETFIDQTVATISEAVARDYARWEYVTNHHQQISDIKYFLNTRIKWMTDNLGSYSSCSTVAVPSLVITKIMYHPEASVYSPDNDDLEFIEIMNNSDRTVDLTGIYFGGTGFVYQFPVNSTLDPYNPVFLASNSKYFQLEYGFIPYGQFTRHLSNKSENLVLLDAFGNIIDNVNYNDSVPWPDADGNGYYLLLADADFDNNVAENWIISSNQLLSKNDVYSESELQLSPNPVTDILKIKAPYVIRSVALYDIYGRLLENIVINDGAYDLDMKQYAKGLYILRVVIAGKTFSRKIIKD